MVEPRRHASAHEIRLPQLSCARRVLECPHFDYAAKEIDRVQYSRVRILLKSAQYFNSYKPKPWGRELIARLMTTIKTLLNEMKALISGSFCVKTSLDDQ